MTEEASAALVLGIGNVLWADEGFGVRCIEALTRRFAPGPGVRLLDGGTQGLYLLPFVSAARHLLVFDAIDYGLAPGALRVIEGENVPCFMGAKKMSLHQTGFQEVLAAAQMLGQFPSQVTLIGVQPEQLEDFGGSLRPVVKARIDEALHIARAKVHSWGYTLEALDGAEDSAAGDALSMERYERERPDASAACRYGDERFLRQVPGSV